jgi:hypothetical protein
MKLVYITEAGDDTNDGMSVEKAVYSWERALKIKGRETASKYLSQQMRWSAFSTSSTC